MSLCWSSSLRAQLFFDDFEDGQLDQGTLWYGDTSLVKHSRVDGISLLQSDATERGSFRLWSPLMLDSSSEPEKPYLWEGYFRIRGTAPSRQNRLDILLTMTSTIDPDQMPPIDSLFYGDAWNGYGLRIGETGDDSLRFVRWDEGEPTIIGTYKLRIEAGTGYHYRIEFAADRKWKLRVDEGYPNSSDYLQVDEAIFTDNTHKVAGFAGFFISCTSTRVDDFYLDFKLDPNIPPPPPFHLKGLQFLDSKRISLIFSDAINSGVLNASEFMLRSFKDGPENDLTGSPVSHRAVENNQRAQSWSLEKPNKLILEWANELNYLRYILTIPPIYTTDGRPLNSPLTNFVALTKEPDPDSVFISEFLANPSSESNWPEYVEIFNRSHSAIDLSSSFLGDANSLQRLDSTFQSSDSVFFGPIIIDPKSYMVFSRQPRILKEWNQSGRILSFDLPYLNNSTDIISWIWAPSNDSSEASSVVLDEVEYKANWLADYVSIERKMWDKPSQDHRNWGPSKGIISDGVPSNMPQHVSSANSRYPLAKRTSSTTGYGTPGLPNTVELDTVAPSLTNFSFTTQNQLMISFDESVLEESLSLKLARDSSFVHPIQAQPLGKDEINQRFYFQLMEPLTAEERIYLQVMRASDWFGNSQIHPIRWIQFLPKDSLIEGELVINELLLEPNEQWPYEYVELYNHSTKYAHLDGWSLRDKTGFSWTFPDDLILYPNEFLLLTSDTHSLPSLNNDSDELILSNAQGKIIDSLNYNKEWFHYDIRFLQNWGLGRSLERKSPLLPTNDPTNWYFHPFQDQGSPRRSNPMVGEYSPVDLITASIEPLNRITGTQENVHIHLQLSHFIPEQKKWNLFIEFDGRRIDLELDTLATLANRPRLFPHHYFVWSFANEQLPSIHELRQEGNWTLVIHNITDVDEDGQHQSLSMLSTPVAFPPQVGSLGFHEIMFDPLNDFDDFEPNGVEYIELWNQDKVSLSLDKLTLGSAQLENGQRLMTHFFSTRFKWVEPNQAVLLVPSPHPVALDEHPIQNRHNIPLLNDQSVLMSQGKQFGLKKESDRRVLLIDTLLIDSLYYHQEWHNPNLYDTKGIALERIDPNPSQRSSRN